MTIIYKIKDNKDNKDKENITIFGLDFVQNNKDKCKLIIDGYEMELQSQYTIDTTKTKDILKIKLIETRPIIDMSFMFCNCKSLISLPDISKWDMTNVTDMTEMFKSCESLTFLSDISVWNTKNVKKMCFMFKNCKSLKYLPDISNWDITNVTHISYFFSDCQSLLYLPDISKWNTINLEFTSRFFYNCHSLRKYPNISKWNIDNIQYSSKIINENIDFELIKEWFENEKFIKKMVLKNNQSSFQIFYKRMLK